MKVEQHLRALWIVALVCLGVEVAEVLPVVVAWVGA